jgi:hypothetical protein
MKKDCFELENYELSSSLTKNILEAASQESFLMTTASIPPPPFTMTSVFLISVGE